MRESASAFFSSVAGQGEELVILLNFYPKTCDIVQFVRNSPYII